MAKKSLDIAEPIYRHTCRVLYGDTDSGGVVYYANYLRYFEAARTEFMRDRLSSYRSLEDLGFILPVAECHVRYKAPARYDDLLTIETCLLDVKKVACRFNYKIIREADQKVLVQGYTVHAVVDKTGKLCRLPEEYIPRLLENASDL